MGESLRTRGKTLKQGRPINILHLGAERRKEGVWEEPLLKGLQVNFQGRLVLPYLIIWKRLGSFFGAAGPQARAGEDGNV